MKPAPFEFVVAESVADAVATLAKHQGQARLLAGGQSLVPLLNMRIVRPAAVVDINRLPGLETIGEDGDLVRVGTLVRYSALEQSPIIRKRLPLLATAVRFVGDRQVRNRGTLGGSLAQGDPSGEMPVATLALDARVSVTGPNGTREVAAEDFFLGPYTTALKSAEMITEVIFPDASEALHGFAEHTRRHGDFAVVSVAVIGVPSANGRWARIRLALGGVSDRPFLATRASAILTGSRLEPDVVGAAARACVEAADPASDARASAEYRRHLIPVYVERAVEQLRVARGKYEA